MGFGIGGLIAILLFAAIGNEVAPDLNIGIIGIVLLFIIGGGIGVTLEKPLKKIKAMIEESINKTE